MRVSEPEAGPPTSTSATASVVCGAAGILIGWFCGLFFPLGVAAIFLGIQGILQSRSTGVGRPRAITGIALGAIALIAVPLAGAFLTIRIS